MEIKSNWYKIDVCVNCHSRLYNDEKMYSGGVCPYCGHLGSATICKTYPVILREIKHKRWWQFWIDKPNTYEGRDDISKQWLIREP